MVVGELAVPPARRFRIAAQEGLTLYVALIAAGGLIIENRTTAPLNMAVPGGMLMEDLISPGALRVGVRPHPRVALLNTVTLLGCAVIELLSCATNDVAMRLGMIVGELALPTTRTVGIAPLESLALLVALVAGRGLVIEDHSTTPFNETRAGGVGLKDVLGPMTRAIGVGFCKGRTLQDAVLFGTLARDVQLGARTADDPAQARGVFLEAFSVPRTAAIGVRRCESRTLLNALCLAQRRVHELEPRPAIDLAERLRRHLEGVSVPSAHAVGIGLCTQTTVVDARTI